MYLEKHHIVFKRQGGLDFELNYKRLSPEDHRGNHGPHLNRKVDLAYKIEMEKELNKVLDSGYYNIAELIEILGLKEKQANRAFRKILSVNGILKEDVIFRLMGNKSYI